MKRILILTVCLASLGFGATPGMITRLHSQIGDSSHFLRSIDTVDVDLNINGTHIWDFTDAAIHWAEVKQYYYIKKASDGLFGSVYPESLLVIQNLSAIDTMETYYLEKDSGLDAYGFTTLRDRIATHAEISIGGPARIMIYPSTLGDNWFDQYIMTSGDATIFAKSWFELVDTGQVYTPVDTFPCVVVRIHQELEVKVLGITIQRLTFYRYDWAVDSLTTIVTIQSRDDETRPLFTKAVKIFRVTDLSYYPPDSTPAILEKPRPADNGCFVRPTADGLKITYSFDRSAPVRLTLFDVSGRPVARKELPIPASGRNEILWPVSIPTGVYIARFESGGQVQVTKVVFIR
jgi:hypothetical protein